MRSEDEFGQNWWSGSDMILGMIAALIIGVVGTLMFVWLS